MVALGEYDLTQHALEEMANDYLYLSDIEHALLHGEITRVETGDIRGTRYTLVGPARDMQTSVGMVGRITKTHVFLIITVYEVTEADE